MADDFDAISRSLWQDMRAGTPYEQPQADTGEYTADFYGEILKEGINFDKLTKFTEHAHNSNDLIFNWEDYRGSNMLQGRLLQFKLPGEDLLPESIKKYINFYNTTPITYIDDKGIETAATFRGRLNKRKDYIDGLPGYSICINPAKKEIWGTLIYFYENTNQYRQMSLRTTDPNDFWIDSKYWAIAITTGNLADFYYLMRYVRNDTEASSLKSKIIDRFLKQVVAAKTQSEKKFLYSFGPDFAIQGVEDKQLWDDFIALLDYDDKGVFSGWKDASNAVIKILNGFKSADFLFKKLEENQALIKRIYDGLDGSQTIDEKTMTNQGFFAHLLWALQNAKPKKEKSKITLLIGEDYIINSNVVSDSNEDEKDNSGKFYLRQQKKETKISVYADSGGYVGTNTVYEDVGTVEDPFYNPFDVITLKDVATGETKNVPAIYVKYIADEAKWERIKEGAVFALTIAALIASIITLGTASGTLALVIAGTDVVITSVDVYAMALPDGPEKKWFEEYWQPVSATVGVIALSDFLIRGVLLNAPKLLKNLRVALTKAAEARRSLNQALELAVKEMKIGKFVKGAFGYIPFEKISTIKELNISGLLAKKMRKANIVVAHNPGDDAIALIYEGEVISVGTPTEMRKQLDEIFTWARKDSEIAEHLDDLKLHEYDNILGDGIYGGKILSQVDIDDWAKLLLKKFGTKLEKVDEFSNPSTLAAFDPKTNTIKYKDNVTEYLMTHESYHAEEMHEIGIDEYIKDFPLYENTKYWNKKNWIRLYKREGFVYKKIKANVSRLNLTPQENWHYQAYFLEIGELLKEANVKIPKL